jgi:4-amino-4-deoxy-L-arabinose transferase-like glycosyltransferase
MFIMIFFSIFHYGNSTLLGNFYNPNNDDVKYIRSAWILAQTGNYTFHKPPSPTVFMMPGLPYVLAFFMKLFGEFGGITVLRIVQAALQVLSLLLIFYIARKLFNSKVAIVAVIFDLFYIPEVWIANLILTETFFKFFVLCIVYFSLYALDEHKTKFYVLGGVFLGFAALFRPTIVMFPILILILWVIKKVKFRDAFKYTAIVGVVFCIVFSPWWIRNYIIFNRFIPFTLSTGNPMWQGTFINYNQKSKINDGLDYTNYDTKNPKLSEIQRNDMEIALSKYRLKNLFPKEPLSFIYWYTIGKGWIQINSPFYWKGILGVSGNLARVFHRILLILGVIGILMYLKNKNKNILGILPIMTLIYFVVVYLPFYTMGRYFYPVMPYMIIFSSYCLVGICEKIFIKNEKCLTR